jgi:hypothetical protein
MKPFSFALILHPAVVVPKPWIMVCKLEALGVLGLGRQKLLEL